MNTNKKEKVELAVMYLERMAAGKLPFSNMEVSFESDLNSPEVVRGLFFARDVMKEIVDDNRLQGQKRVDFQFPISCLKDFQYEEDKTITNFVQQLKRLSGSPNVKGLSVKRVTDWLKQNYYLQEGKNVETGDKITSITKSGEEAGLYEQTRNTRFGQEYKVIMYSEKAQNWIVENLPEILGENR